MLCAFTTISRRDMTRLMVARYVENTLEHNRKFDAKSLASQDSSREGRLKYWTNELCERHPQTFDFVVTVCPAISGSRRRLTRL